ncbi:MAG: hypothetical protein NTY19_48635 [Planctomycetota bacterium]|nr:hypothetical protein [Planctomycetota bacterium]
MHLNTARKPTALCRPDDRIVLLAEPATMEPVLRRERSADPPALRPLAAKADYSQMLLAVIPFNAASRAWSLETKNCQAVRITADVQADIAIALEFLFLEPQDGQSMQRLAAILAQVPADAGDESWLPSFFSGAKSTLTGNVLTVAFSLTPERFLREVARLQNQKKPEPKPPASGPESKPSRP